MTDWLTYWSLWLDGTADYGPRYIQHNHKGWCPLMLMSFSQHGLLRGLGVWGLRVVANWLARSRVLRIHYSITFPYNSMQTLQLGNCALCNLIRLCSFLSSFRHRASVEDLKLWLQTAYVESSHSKALHLQRISLFYIPLESFSLSLPFLPLFLLCSHLALLILYYMT